MILSEGEPDHGWSGFDSSYFHTFNDIPLDDEGATVAKIDVLIRATDPIFELTFRLGVGHKNEDDFWFHHLEQLAKRFGVDGHVQLRSTLVDPRMNWKEFRNIWRNGAIHTILYLLGSPFRWLFGRKPNAAQDA